MRARSPTVRMPLRKSLTAVAWTVSARACSAATRARLRCTAMKTVDARIVKNSAAISVDVAR